MMPHGPQGGGHSMPGVTTAAAWGGPALGQAEGAFRAGNI